jgi:hypothetical protein
MTWEKLTNLDRSGRLKPNGFRNCRIVKKWIVHGALADRGEQQQGGAAG